MNTVRGAKIRIQAMTKKTKIFRLPSAGYQNKGGLYANAEFQWRLSQPIIILILSVFGVFLGKTSPRGGKGVNLLIGIVLFMFYNNVLLVAKSAAEQGQISVTIGLWGVHLLVVVLLFLLYQLRQGKITNYLYKLLIFNNKKKSHA